MTYDLFLTIQLGNWIFQEYLPTYPATCSWNSAAWSAEKALIWFEDILVFFWSDANYALTDTRWHAADI